MADTRQVVNGLVDRYEHVNCDAETSFAFAEQCFAHDWTEDKLAGVLLLAELGFESVDSANVEDLSRPLADGSIADWNVGDWYCVRVLGPFMTAGSDIEERALAVASWVSAPVLRQRRAGVVALVNAR